ncbi:MAG: ArnT family glycosyltransferase [Candidatus Micrarchaeia archaeon]
MENSVERSQVSEVSNSTEGAVSKVSDSSGSVSGDSTKRDFEISSSQASVSSSSEVVENKAQFEQKGFAHYAPLAFVLLLSVFVFFTALSNAHNVLWWDETEYALLAKNIVEDGRYSYWDDFYYYWFEGDSSFRPPLLPALLANSYFIFGQGELSMRIVVPFLSALSVLATFIVVRRLFGSFVGAISAALLSFVSLFWFFAGRVLTETPLVFFSAMIFYVFFRIFEERKWRWLPVLAVLVAMGFLMKYTLLAILPSFAVIFLLYYRGTFLEALRSSQRNKLVLYLVAAVLTFAVFVFPMLWFSTKTVGGPLTTMQVYLESAVPIGEEQFLFYFINASNIFSGMFVLLLIIAGMVYAFYRNDKTAVQLTVIIFTLLLMLTFVIEHREDRYALLVFPFAFGLAALVAFRGIAAVLRMRSLKDVSLFRLGFVLLLVLPALFFGTVGNFEQAQAQVDYKIDSYLGVAEAGRFIKTNSLPGARVVSDSFFQTGYYSDRPVEWLPEDQGEFVELLEKSNARFVEFSAYQHGVALLAQASDALSKNQSPPYTSGAYVLTHPAKFELVFEHALEGHPPTYVFEIKR